MTADNKCLCYIRQNFLQPIQMQLSKKRKTFCKIFIGVAKFTQNFENFEKKDEPHSLCFAEIVVYERRGYLDVYKVLFQNTLRQSTC